MPLTVTVNTIAECLRTDCTVWGLKKNQLHTVSDCYVALDTQHAIRMRCIIPSSVACMAVQYFPHYLINGKIFRENVTEHEMCILVSSRILSETLIIPMRTERDMIRKMYNDLDVK